VSRWAVVGVPDTLRHGGDLRASHIFRDLIERTQALTFYRPDLRLLARASHHPMSLLPGVNVAAAELLPQASLPFARRMTHLRLLDLHDHPVLQADAIGFSLEPRTRAAQLRLTRMNIEAFNRVIVVSESFADLAGVPADRRITVPNGTNTEVIVPGPWPSRPTIGFISGAAPGRGIEVLVEASRLVRHSIGDLRLKLGLTATDRASAQYLAALRNSLSQHSWIEISSVPYLSLSAYLADTTVLAIPHPPHPYIDSAVPVKLLDSMAAGRPVVVTPRTETASIVRAANAGIIVRSDEPGEIADDLMRCLEDGALRQTLGDNGRRAAVERFDWRVLSQRVSEAAFSMLKRSSE
jgi:colanic acid biosynthesis glycosyl transferase WcaI